MRKKKQATSVIDENLKIRLQRAKSWFAKAENAEDEETRFISLWISFNSAYATKGQLGYISNKIEFGRFIKMICLLDHHKVLYKSLWGIYSENIRILINDYSIFQPYWDSKDNEIHYDWQKKFKYSQKRVNKGFKFQNAQIILLIIFDRIYTLRNQIFHGGTSFYDLEKQQSLKCANEVMTVCLPLIFHFMEEHADKIQWGRPFFFLVNNKNFYDRYLFRIKNSSYYRFK